MNTKKDYAYLDVKLAIADLVQAGIAFKQVNRSDGVSYSQAYDTVTGKNVKNPPKPGGIGHAMNKVKSTIEQAMDPNAEKNFEFDPKTMTYVKKKEENQWEGHQGKLEKEWESKYGVDIKTQYSFDWFARLSDLKLKLDQEKKKGGDVTKRISTLKNAQDKLIDEGKKGSFSDDTSKKALQEVLNEMKKDKTSSKQLQKKLQDVIGQWDKSSPDQKKGAIILVNNFLNSEASRIEKDQQKHLQDIQDEIDETYKEAMNSLVEAENEQEYPI